MALLHPDRHVLYQAVGGPEPPVPDTGRAARGAGDVWLLLSDGAVDGLEDEALRAALEAAGGDPAGVARWLLQRAEAERRGNATVIAARFAGGLSAARDEAPGMAYHARR